MLGEPPLVCPADPHTVDVLATRLVTPLTLVGQAVAAALRSNGIDVLVDPSPASGEGRRPEVLLVIDDLVSPADVRRVLGLLHTATAPVLVLTGRERGPYWGALLSAGAASVVSSAVGIDALVGTLRSLQRGARVPAADECRELVVTWHDFEREQRMVADRLKGLTPREQGVLAGLCDGETVSDIAVILAVREATVRSHVKAILRKLGVRTQLAAVALARGVQAPLVVGAHRFAAPARQQRKVSSVR